MDRVYTQKINKKLGREDKKLHTYPFLCVC